MLLMIALHENEIWVIALLFPLLIVSGRGHDNSHVSGTLVNVARNIKLTGANLASRARVEDQVDVIRHPRALHSVPLLLNLLIEALFDFGFASLFAHMLLIG